MKIYGNSYRARILKMEPTKQEEYVKPEEDKVTYRPQKRLTKQEIFKAEEKRQQRRNYQKGYRKRLAKELREDPNSPRHGTSAIMNLSNADRCTCPKCLAYVRDTEEERKRRSREYCKKYYQEHPERRREVNRKYREKQKVKNADRNTSSNN